MAECQACAGEVQTDRNICIMLLTSAQTQRIPSDVKAECMQTPARQPEPMVSHVLSPRLWAGFHLSACVCATVGSGLYC